MSAILILARRIAISAWRYRWAAVAVSWIVCGLGWAYVYTIPNTYEASARVYVNADSVLTPLLRGIAVDNSLATQLDVLQRTLLSRPNLEKLVSNTDLDLTITGPADLDAMVTRLASDIRIVPQTNNLFTITYRNTSPKLAFDVVQTILNTFIESKTGNNRSEMQNAQMFLQQQLSDYERQLRDAEKKRADFRAKYVDLLPVGDSGVNRLDQQESVLRQLRGSLDDALAKQALLKNELSTTSPLIATESEAIAAAGGVRRDPQVEAAQRTLDDLLLRDTDSHPDVIAARAQLAAAKAEAARDLAAIPRPASPSAKGGPGSPAPGMRNTRSLPNPVYEQLKVQMVDADSSVASLQRQVSDATRERDRLDTMARNAPGVQAEYLNLNRDYDVLSKNYRELLARRESMRIATASNADQVKIEVIDPPQVPQNPVAPKRVLLLSAVLGLGIAAGAALAVLLVQFDSSFHSIDELRDLGFPVAGGVSLLNIAVTRGRLAAVLAFGLSLAMLGVVYAGLFYKFMHTPGLI
jgi:polysaccharide chain length determinant protein (PEP-CTERM system associated)